jgi:hypothetical protein
MRKRYQAWDWPRAIGTKETLLSESLATFESLTKVAADLDVQIKRMEA